MQVNGEGSSSIDMSRIHDNFPTIQSMYCIRRVDNQLRTVTEKAYEPVIIAIGPYHRGKNKLNKMEKQKDGYLRELGTELVEECFQAVRALEKQARECYVELPDLTSDEFVNMLVLDGCFIVKLFIKFFEEDSYNDTNDEIFQKEWNLICVRRDLLLFENQIPFFVLFKLFNMIELNRDFVQLAMRFFEDILPGRGYFAQRDPYRPEDSIHLLSLIHDNWLPNFDPQETITRNQKNLDLILSATELREAGVKFEQANGGRGLLYIKFQGDTLQIPFLDITKDTECFFRNFIAYEEYYQYVGDRHIISYVTFLNCLVKSPRDVQILRRGGIIRTTLANETVSEIFNRINESITEPGFSHYSNLFSKVNDHCSKRRNRWKAILCHEYLHSPWGVISVFAASFILICTLIQSIYAVLSYKK